MGAKITTLNEWWDYLQEKKFLIDGPQIAFNLKKNDKNVLLFGENHQNSNRKCGPLQKSFLNLFNNFIKQKNCNTTDILIELTQEHLNYLKNNKYSNLENDQKLDKLAYDFIKNYPNEETCVIRLLYSNPSKLNIIVSKCINCLNKIIQKKSSNIEKKIVNNLFEMRYI